MRVPTAVVLWLFLFVLFGALAAVHVLYSRGLL
jgi:hypothetical protein